MLKITPHNTGAYSPKFTGENSAKEKTYNDPLMNWPIRGLAYSNELGAAISEVAPKLGTLLWFPAMLYFGADIYDKYKNEKTSFDPNAQRGTKQAIFQLLASVVLPTAAVITGHKAASAIGAMDKSGLTLQTRVEIINFMKEHNSRRHLGEYAETEVKQNEFKKLFEESFTIKREKLIRESKLGNPIRFIVDSIFSKHRPNLMAKKSQKDITLSFAKDNIDTMFKIYNNLHSGEKPSEFTNKLWEKFNKLKIKYANDPYYKEPGYEKDALRDAAEDIIKKFNKNRMTKLKMWKTLGGFVALGLAIKPIDHFVEKVIIKKVVEPNLGNAFNNKNEKKA